MAESNSSDFLVAWFWHAFHALNLSSSVSDSLRTNTMATTVANAVAAIAGNMSFTRFEVVRRIRMQNSEGELFMPIDAGQNETVLAQIAKHDQIYSPLQGLELVIHTVDGEDFAIVIHDKEEQAAKVWDDSDYEFAGHAYAGVKWVVQAYAAEAPDVAHQLITGNDESVMRDMCASMQAIVDLQARVHAFKQGLVADGRAPTGEDYTTLIGLLGI
jgi:hypothetical protein